MTLVIPLHGTLLYPLGILARTVPSAIQYSWNSTEFTNAISDEIRKEASIIMPLPDQRYIDHIVDALWSRAGRASVMVGSGFSKHAQPTRPDSGELPLWHELASRMLAKVHPESLRENQHIGPNGASEPGGALCIAQEYSEAFGRGSLHLFIQEQVRDGDFNPGEFHSRLLRLPWRDIFTTNWDTLLERSRISVPGRPYSVVHNKDEIPLSSQPRIVKLHGSLDGHYPLVVTEEDYDDYPRFHAPFVNTVQQAMMETVLCLVGFSGNDPNFLKWSSWVKKNLGKAAPKIYLAGWLKLSAKERECLQVRNVIPIDLAQHKKASQWPNHLRHRYATEWILRTLEGGRPYDVSNWPAPVKFVVPEDLVQLQPIKTTVLDSPVEESWPSSMSDGSLSLEDSLRDLAAIWKKNRELYPGWLIAPLEVRSSVISKTREWQPHILQGLSGLSALEQLNIIRELMWRHEIALEPISPELESNALDSLALVDGAAQVGDDVVKLDVMQRHIREACREVALMLVTIARHRLDEKAFFQRLEAANQFLDDASDVAHRIQHERCLWAAWSLDFATLDGLLSDWKTVNCDPMWMLRKSALLGEIGRDDEVEALTEQALTDIRRFPADDRSVAGPSREGWALWSTIDLENRLEVFKRWNELAPRKCDAYSEKTEIANALSPKETSQALPDFDLGAGRDVWSIRSEPRSSLAPAYRAIRLSEVAGLAAATPTAFPSRATAADILQLAAGHLVNVNAELAVRLVLRSCTYQKDDTLLRVLLRQTHCDHAR